MDARVTYDAADVTNQRQPHFPNDRSGGGGCDLSRDAVSRDEEINVFVACYINPAEDAVAQFDSFQISFIYTGSVAFQVVYRKTESPPNSKSRN